MDTFDLQNFFETQLNIDMEAFLDASSNIGKLFINPFAMPMIKARISPMTGRYFRNWRRLHDSWGGANLTSTSGWTNALLKHNHLLSQLFSSSVCAQTVLHIWLCTAGNMYYARNVMTATVLMLRLYQHAIGILSEQSQCNNTICSHRGSDVCKAAA